MYTSTYVAQTILYNFQMERFEVFKAQDPESTDFDIVFEISGKVRYLNLLKPY